MSGSTTGNLTPEFSRSAEGAICWNELLCVTVKENEVKAIAGILALLVTMPIWFFLLYRVLDAVNASELMWFLYWIYVPATILVNSLTKLAEDA